MSDRTAAICLQLGRQKFADSAVKCVSRGWPVRGFERAVCEREIETVLLTADGTTNTTIEGKYVTARTNPITGAEEIIGLAAGHTGIVGDTYKPFQNESLTDYPQTMTDEVRGFPGHRRLDARRRGCLRHHEATEDHDGRRCGRGERQHRGAEQPHRQPGDYRADHATRVVCGNTQRAALGNASATFKVRHTENAGDRVQEARDALDLTWKCVAAFEVEAEKMIQGQLAEEAFRKVCDEIWAPLTATATGRSKTIAVNRAL